MISLKGQDMKKTFLFSLAFFMLLTMAGCGGEKTPSETDKSSSAVETTETVTSEIITETTDLVSKTVTSVSSETKTTVLTTDSQTDAVSHTEKNISSLDNEPLFETKELKFKTGTWSAGNDQNYVFLSNGTDGKIANTDMGIGVPFIYEYSGSDYTFHIGGADSTDKATVTFSSENKAEIQWERGTFTELVFLSERTDDDFAYGRIPDGVTKNFKVGKWNSSFGEEFIFNADETSGEMNGLSFTYEKNDFDYTFYFDNENDGRKAAVIFSSPERAVLKWNDGSSEVLNFSE